MPHLTTTKSWKELDKRPGILYRISTSDTNKCAHLLKHSLMKKATVSFLYSLHKNIKQSKAKFHLISYFSYIFPFFSHLLSYLPVFSVYTLLLSS